MYLKLLYRKKEDLMRQHIGQKVKLSPLSGFSKPCSDKAASSDEARWKTLFKIQCSLISNRDVCYAQVLVMHVFLLYSSGERFITKPQGPGWRNGVIFHIGTL